MTTETPQVESDKVSFIPCNKEKKKLSRYERKLFAAMDDFADSMRLIEGPVYDKTTDMHYSESILFLADQETIARRLAKFGNVTFKQGFDEGLAMGISIGFVGMIIMFFLCRYEMLSFIK